jgi:hypothetical protein
MALRLCFFNVTVTYQTKFVQKWDTWLEYRYDIANEAIFTDNDGLEKKLASVVLVEACTF